MVRPAPQRDTIGHHHAEISEVVAAAGETATKILAPVAAPAGAMKWK
jgi:hypothetical protein